MLPSLDRCHPLIAALSGDCFDVQARLAEIRQTILRYACPYHAVAGILNLIDQAQRGSDDDLLYAIHCLRCVTRDLLAIPLHDRQASCSWLFILGLERHLQAAKRFQRQLEAKLWQKVRKESD